MSLTLSLMKKFGCRFMVFVVRICSGMQANGSLNHRAQRSLHRRNPKSHKVNKALWRSWLARRPVTAEVAGSSPVRVAQENARHSRKRQCYDYFPWPDSSVGRASA